MYSTKVFYINIYLYIYFIKKLKKDKIELADVTFREDPAAVVPGPSKLTPNGPGCKPDASRAVKSIRVESLDRGTKDRGPVS
jgi:hypothetical protein